MPELDESSAKVTMLMLYKELRETKEMLIEMRTDLHTQKRQADDHEQRIRSLERARWIIAGISAAGGGSVAAIISKMFGA